MAKVAYRGVKVTTWNDERFITLPDEAKLVWFHVYTNRLSNGLGMFQASIEGLAADMRWDLKRYTKRFKECCSKGLFVYSETYHVVYFPNFIKHNKPANPNVLKSLLSSWDYIPNTKLKALLYKELQGLGDGYEKAMETLQVTLPQTYSETETITETDTGSNSVPKGTGAEAPSDNDLRKIIFDTGVNILKPVQKDEKKSRSMIGKWIKSYGDAFVYEAIVNASKSTPAHPIEYITKHLERLKDEANSSNNSRKLTEHNQINSTNWSANGQVESGGQVTGY